MLAELIDKIAYYVDASQKPHEFKKDHQTCYRYRDGHTEDVDDPFPARASTCYTLDSFLAAVERYKEDTSVIFVSRDVAQMTIDDEGYRENAIALTLTISDERKALTGLPCTLTQRQAINFLRENFRDERLMNLVAALRKVDFTRLATGSSEVKHGADSFGKTVERKIQATDSIPESVTISVPWFNTKGLCAKFDFEIGIEILTSDESFRLFAMPNAFSKAQTKAIDFVVGALGSTGLTVLAGEA